MLKEGGVVDLILILFPCLRNKIPQSQHIIQCESRLFALFISMASQSWVSVSWWQLIKTHKYYATGCNRNHISELCKCVGHPLNYPAAQLWHTHSAVENNVSCVNNCWSCGDRITVFFTFRQDISLHAEWVSSKSMCIPIWSTLIPYHSRLTKMLVLSYLWVRSPRTPTVSVTA